MTTVPGNQQRRPDRAALAIAAALVVLGLIIAWDASQLGAGGAYARIGPQTIPYVIALCLGGLAAWTVIEALRGDFPEREPQDFPPVLWIVGGLLAQMLLIRFVGFSIATGNSPVPISARPMTTSTPRRSTKGATSRPNC